MDSISAAARHQVTADELGELYVWGFPLVQVHRTRRRQLADVGPVLERADLADASSRAVVGPNNDTLYSSRWFDLRAGDLTIDVPRFADPDRYWSVMLLDAYTHVRYVSRRTHGRDGAEVRVVLDPAASTLGTGAPDGSATVALGTPTVWVLVRVLVDGPDDLDAARAAQRSIRVHQARDPRSMRPAADAPSTDADRSAAGAPGSWFSSLATAVASDPPVPGQPPPPAALDHLPELLADPAAADLLAEGERAGKASLAAAGSGADTFGNGWGTRRRGADFGDDATYRAAFARVSLAGHLPEENRSYSAGIDGTRPVALCFPAGGEPPVGAFWSLTLYGPDLFFVPNELGRFSIGDRTPGLCREPDGGLTIVIGHEPQRDEQGRAVTANWLPAPPGPAFAVLRCYEGAPAIVDATWFPPPLVPLEAT